MISFRSHIASLVAVFLALAVGIVLGAGPLQQENSSSGDGSSDSEVLAAAELEVDRLREAADFDDAYARDTRPRVVDDNLLQGRTITLMALPTADEDQITELGALASNLGASIAARVNIGDQLVDVANRQLVEELGTRMRASAGDAVDIPSTADGYERMGRLLGFAVTTDKPGGAQLDGVAEEIIASLVTAELIEVDGGGVQQRGSLVLIVAGEPEGTLDQRRGAGSIVAALASALDATGKGVVVAGPIDSGARDGVVGAVRRSRSASEVSTVDVTDRDAGVVLTMLALAAEDGGSAVHLGTSASEDGAFPGSDSTG